MKVNTHPPNETISLQAFAAANIGFAICAQHSMEMENNLSTCLPEAMDENDWFYLEFGQKTQGNRLLRALSNANLCTFHLGFQCE